LSVADERLRPGERVSRKRDFQLAYQQGLRLSGRWFIAYVRFREEGPLRVGVVASRRVGGAVERNRAKRRLREVFRRNRPRKSVSADVVLIARVALLDASAGEIEDFYRRSVRRALEERNPKNR
jgi:ribonuclease P protein component